MERLKHVIRSQQFSPNILFDLFNRADSLRIYPQPTLDHKILATLFYEPSTRTRLSFEAAMIRMGGHVIGTENAKQFSSVVKGESLEDTVRVIGAYVDVIVMRNDEKDTAEAAAKVSPVPIINGGDGPGQHPTQALLDMYTLYKEFGRLENLRIALVGDLKNGRTVRSLCYLLGKFSGNSITFFSPEELMMKDDIKNYLTTHNTEFHEVIHGFDDYLPGFDAVYLTRIQDERDDGMSKEKVKKFEKMFSIDMNNLHYIHPNSRILHPLPKRSEIDLSIKVEDNDYRVAYFRQAENGLYIRMALLEHLLNV